MKKIKSQHINFKEKELATLPVPTKEMGQQVYYDTGTKDGLSVIITYGGSKTYYFLTYFHGRTIRVKLGKVGQIKLCKAREKAHTLKETANHGDDPSTARHEDLRDITLKDFYNNHYKPQHSELFKKRNSILTDEIAFKHSLPELHNRKMISITTGDISRLHNQILKRTSPYTANRMLSLISHLYTKATEWNIYPKRLGNPTSGIKKFKERSRDRFMNADEIRRFFMALSQENNHIFRNYVLLSLFLGQRRNNILTMRWSDIDLQNGFAYFAETKNYEPLQVPLTTHASALFREIQKVSESEWVLPSATSKSGHYEEPKRSWQNLLERAEIENLRLHDLRRTLGSYQAIAGASLHIIGKSLGHKSTAATQIYARLSVDPVRDSMQKATDKMMEFVKNN